MGDSHGLTGLQAPIAPPRESTPKQPDNQQEDHSANGGDNDRTDKTSANVDTQTGQQPTADQGTNYSDGDVAD